MSHPPERFRRCSELCSARTQPGGFFVGCQLAGGTLEAHSDCPRDVTKACTIGCVTCSPRTNSQNDAASKATKFLR